MKKKDITEISMSCPECPVVQYHVVCVCHVFYVCMSCVYVMYVMYVMNAMFAMHMHARMYVCC